MKRLFDIICSLGGLLLLSPLFLLIALTILFSSGKPVLYRQVRVGRYGKDFKLFKFRTMYPGSDKMSLLTVGGGDRRITPEGKILRKYKLDELPQLINVLTGKMSLVGPRPEVRKYVEMYNGEQKKILQVRPGITDFASIRYVDENEILGEAPDPEWTYIHLVMPDKLRLNGEYIEKAGFLTDLRILFMTFRRILGKRERPVQR